MLLKDDMSFLDSPSYIGEMLSVSETNNVDASGPIEIDAFLPKYYLCKLIEDILDH